MSVYQMSINNFLQEASSSSPTPGGGNVSALVGTLGASMGAMVANLTKDKKGYEEHQEETARILEILTDGIEDLKRLTNEDMDAFASYMETFRLPKNTDEEKKVRTEKIQLAAKRATIAPLNICKKCLDLMEANTKLSYFGNKSAISDCGVSAILLEASLRAAMLSVDINIPSIKDKEFVENIKNERGRLLIDAEELKNLALCNMRSRW